MNSSFFTAAVGAAQQQLRLNVQANNIANVNTYGFKAQKPTFASLMYGNVNGINNQQLPRGSGAKMAMDGTDFSGGAIADTGCAQDYAIIGEGFFGLYDPTSGEVSYTRDGSFSLSEFQRQKRTDDGSEVELDENGQPEMETVYMLSDGMGRFVLNNRGAVTEVTDPEAKQPVGVFDFTNTDGMTRMSENRYMPTGKNGQVRFGTGTVQQGSLEASNTDLAEQITKVIEAQRSFSYNLKMVTTSDELESTVNNLRS
ncbi:flagellar basal-body rod protein FlgG [Oscillibacter valericigenes Sjm18-20]|nr:flagellar basal-body rod protein FlgG [Oscillibacter valericigenes Sjm18-20]